MAEPEFDTKDPEWTTDFGPPASKRKRIALASLCIVLVLGFLGVAIWAGQSSPSRFAEARPGKLDTGIPTWILFIPFAIFLVAIGLYAERIALWIQRKLNWKPDVD